MISQTSFGARIDNAKKVLVHLSTFTGYNPPVEQTAEALSNFLTALEKHNADAASKAESNSNAKEMRRQAFKTGNGSLRKMSLQVLAAVRSQYGIKSRQATDVKVIVNRITGSVGKKTTKPPVPENPPTATQTPTDTESKSVSKRETGFGNMLKTFADVVATVKNYGATYTPGNTAITTGALQTRLKELSEINRNATASYSVLKQSQLERMDLYKQLKDKIQRIKNAVKSQYDIGSVEYGLIKGIKV